MNFEKRKALQAHWDRQLETKELYTDYGTVKSIYVLLENDAEVEFADGTVQRVFLEFIKARWSSKMTVKELKEKATFVGSTILRNQKYDYMSGKYEDVINTDLQYYFDENMVEIGYVAFVHSRFESVHIFPNGRKWGKENLNNLTIRRL